MNEILKVFSDGGPVMWPILGLSVLGLAIVADRLFAFRAFSKKTVPVANPQKRLNELQCGFGMISTIITAEPMLGILGTVTGIIKTFGAFNLAENASPLAATAGIGEALITTAAGIVAALILIFPYNFLLGLLAKAAARLESEGENS